jgi:hypothetical protein
VYTKQPSGLPAYPGDVGCDQSVSLNVCQGHLLLVWVVCSTGQADRILLTRGGPHLASQTAIHTYLLPLLCMQTATGWTHNAGTAFFASPWSLKQLQRAS